VTSDQALGVVIIEDQRDVREGLSVLIDGTAGFRCTGAFRTMEDALARIAAGTTDVILTDIGLPGMTSAR
jgi:YesN/AraC family two-component response regulator